ncbi:MAG: hypothetical protein ACD_51C00115G0002 [uncultured bacterium]|nr:MAG: hypothetical protein ACD_51C00115G0002 [uncultured bacterium]OGJ47224.1 MAG: hypothetical protein A2244_00035 [Candidatus Peregrinibacteria bacterium RIFOXYA2_FULL_41_18]OGJ49179.1 MAG: hypothetical protein A2344_04595 [Candidatus Peregrinibacteria bacterium RIFOXYB12_FULL_41_12]OGJ55252.1 MAG: hypothetical protein A2336_05075 [Candidatus Peregrinibacteria bacterium RIFOXYB2_FULL_41_88]
MPEKVIFRAKSDFQKTDCIRHGCTEISTLEAVFGNAMIRCCEQDEYKKIAAEQAITYGKLMDRVFFGQIN